MFASPRRTPSRSRSKETWRGTGEAGKPTEDADTVPPSSAGGQPCPEPPEKPCVQPGVVLHRSCVRVAPGALTVLRLGLPDAYIASRGRLGHWVGPSEARAQTLNPCTVRLRLITIFESLSLKPTWYESAVFFSLFLVTS